MLSTRTVTARSIAINITRIDYLDTYGAWLIERTLRNWTNQGREARLVGLREDYRGLFEKVHAGTQTLSPPPPKRNSIIATLESVGMTMASVGADLVLLAQMIGSLMVAVERVMQAADKLSLHVDGPPARARRMAGGADCHPDHGTDRRHSRAARHFPFPQVWGGHLRHRHGRCAGAARNRRADRLYHGRRPFRQLLHGGARRDAHAGGSRCAAHDGLRPGRGVDFAAYS